MAIKQTVITVWPPENPVINSTPALNSAQYDKLEELFGHGYLVKDHFVGSHGAITFVLELNENAPAPDKQ